MAAVDTGWRIDNSLGDGVLKQATGNVVIDTIVEADITLADNTTDNVSSTKHGFAPKSPADATKFLNGAATPAYAQVKDSDLSTTDITTNNITSSKHGFAPKSPADATQFLNGAATPVFALVKDSDLSTSDITTNNVSITKHGFVPKAPNDATKYLDGTGAFSVPAGGGGGGSTPATVSYAVTKTNFGPSGGTSEADILSFTVPANTWLDGEMIDLEFVVEILNNDANGTFTYKGYWDGNSATINSGASWGQSATIIRSQRMIRWIRCGTDVYIATGTTPGGNSPGNFLADLEFTAQATPGRGGGRLTVQTFNADKIAKVSIQLSVSGGSTYFNILRASVKKTAVS